MNWGKGLAITLIAFAGMMAYFVTRAARNPEPLVTEQYYEQELVYQDRINAKARANALDAPVRITATVKGVDLQFPAAVSGSAITGELSLIRLNDPEADRLVEVQADATGRCERALDLRAGRYRAQLEWRSAGMNYFTETDLLVP